MKWKCHIPGKADTDWDGGFYPLGMEFSEDYPTKPPKVRMRRTRSSKRFRHACMGPPAGRSTRRQRACVTRELC
jgi:hypothetical protein